LDKDNPTHPQDALWIIHSQGLLHQHEKQLHIDFKTQCSIK
jgi:hypothetical protein